MANNVKIFNDDIEAIHSGLDALISDLNQSYQDIVKNGTLVSEKWKGAAAMQTVAAINNCAKDLKKAVEEIEAVKAHVKSTSAAVTEADNSIKNSFRSIIG